MKVLVIAADIGAKSGLGRHSRAIIDEFERQGVPTVALAVEERGFLEMLGNSFTARRAARECDIVHALDGWPFAVYGYAAVLGRNQRLFVNGIGTYSVAPLYSAIKGWLLRRAYTRAEKIFCISRYTKEQLAAAGIQKEKIEIVHYGTPVFAMPSVTDLESCHAVCDIPINSRPIILTVGAIKERKGQLDTLRAVALLAKKYPNILYIAAGSGNTDSYISLLKHYAATQGLTERLRILTDIDDKMLACLYTLSTVFALNSNTDAVRHHFEGFGAVVLEACQFGKPSVGSRESGIEDAIVDGVSGLLTSQKDPSDIAQKIEEVLARYDSFSKNATMRYADFTWRKTIEAYKKFYMQA